MVWRLQGPGYQQQWYWSISSEIFWSQRKEAKHWLLQLYLMSRWRHQIEAFSASLILCAGNSPVTGEFPSQRPVTRSFDVFFDLRLNKKRLSKQWWGWWLETPSRSFWRHWNGNAHTYQYNERWNHARKLRQSKLDRISIIFTLFTECPVIPWLTVALSGVARIGADTTILTLAWLYSWKNKQNVTHYSDVIMCMVASQITSLTIVYSTVYSGEDQRKHQSSASLAFVWRIHRCPVNSPHKWPVTRKMSTLDDVIMT